MHELKAHDVLVPDLRHELAPDSSLSLEINSVNYSCPYQVDIM